MNDKTPKLILPDGWIVKLSKHFPDRVYYFNVHTGSSTWECPTLNMAGTNKDKKSMNQSSAINKQASTKSAREAKSPEIKLDKIEEFLSGAKRESLRRSAENETPSGRSKLSIPPTAIVAPVVLDKSLAQVSKKKKKKKAKRQTVAATLGTPHASNDNSPPGTIVQRDGSGDASKKVSFTVKSQNKVPISKSENAILQKSKSSITFLKKKQSLVISVPASKKQNSAPSSHERRLVTLDKSALLLSSSSSDLLGEISREPSNRSPSLHRRFSSPQARSDKQNNKAEKQCNSSSQNRLKENNKRKSDVLNTVTGESVATSQSPFPYVSDSEVSDMDYEIGADFEDLLVTVSPKEGINVGASTSRGSDPDCYDDIEMLDMSSSDIVTIDDIYGFQGSLVERYFIAVDTNIFISELQYIDELKDTPVNGCGPPHFIIPWVVFQELDNLKRNGGRPKSGVAKEAKARKTYDLMKTAGEAIRYLNTLLKAKHPRFHFQHPDAAKNCRKDFSRNNDDQLLECCLKLQERIPNEKVILLTNDKNLANKAMVCGIAVHDRKSLVNILKPDLKQTKESPPKQVTNPTYVPDPFKVLAELRSLEEKHRTNHSKCELEIDGYMTAARQMLQDVLDHIFEKEMDEAYGTAWHFFKIERHTLRGILTGMVKYWRTVFTFKFSRDFEAKFNMLKEKAVRPEGFLGERAECLNILSVIDELFAVIQRKWPEVNILASEIPKIKALTETAFSNLSECEKGLNSVENAIKQTEMSCCIEVFNHNWTVINQLCGCSADFCGVPHDLGYESVPFPPKSEFLRIMPKLLNSLDQLKEIMERMLFVVKSSTPNGAVFKELHKILSELVPSLCIESPNICLTFFSAKLVERFCRLPENRAIIEGGFQQLLNYHETLGRAVCALNEMP